MFSKLFLDQRDTQYDQNLVSAPDFFPSPDEANAKSFIGINAYQIVHPFQQELGKRYRQYFQKVKCLDEVSEKVKQIINKPDFDLYPLMILNRWDVKNKQTDLNSEIGLPRLNFKSPETKSKIKKLITLRINETNPKSFIEEDLRNLEHKIEIKKEVLVALLQIDQDLLLEEDTTAFLHRKIQNLAQLENKTESETKLLKILNKITAVV